MDIKLQVTEKELKEFPEESTTNINQKVDTHPPKRQLLATQSVRKETLIQPSASIPLYKESLIQPSDPTPLLSLNIQPDLRALAQTLLPEALRYLHISIHISQQISQHGHHHSRWHLDRSPQQRQMRRRNRKPKGEKGCEGTGTAHGRKGRPGAHRCSDTGEYEPDPL